MQMGGGGIALIDLNICHPVMIKCCMTTSACERPVVFSGVGSGWRWRNVGSSRLSAQMELSSSQRGYGRSAAVVAVGLGVGVTASAATGVG
jgi:hypothetical protein